MNPRATGIVVLLHLFLCPVCPGWFSEAVGFDGLAWSPGGGEIAFLAVEEPEDPEDRPEWGGRVMVYEMEEDRLREARFPSSVYAVHAGSGRTLACGKFAVALSGPEHGAGLRQVFFTAGNLDHSGAFSCAGISPDGRRGMVLRYDHGANAYEKLVVDLEEATVKGGTWCSYRDDPCDCLPEGYRSGEGNEGRNAEPAPRVFGAAPSWYTVPSGPTQCSLVHAPGRGDCADPDRVRKAFEGLGAAGLCRGFQAESWAATFLPLGGWGGRAEAEAFLRGSGLRGRLPCLETAEVRAMDNGLCDGRIRAESPDGRRLAYVRVRGSRWGATNAIVVLDIDKGEERVLVPPINNW